jgi:arginine repressor
VADEDIKIGGYNVAADLATIEGEIKRVGRSKTGFGKSGTYLDVDATSGEGYGPLPVTDAAIAGLLAELAQKLEPGQTIALDSGTLAALEQVVVSGIVALDGGTLAALESVTVTIGNPTDVSGLATQATLESVLAKLSADPATQTTLAAVLAKLSADPATQATLAAVLAKLSGDPATQTTLAAVLAKLSGDPATQTTLASVLAALGGTLKTRQAGTYAYKSGTAPAAVDVPGGARVTRINVIPGLDASATITIGGGDTITVLAGGYFDEQIEGEALGTDVVFGGSIRSYYVAWTV